MGIEPDERELLRKLLRQSRRAVVEQLNGRLYISRRTMAFTRRDETSFESQQTIVNDNILRYPAVDVLGIPDWTGWLPNPQAEAEMVYSRFGSACDWEHYFPGQGYPPFDEAPVEHVARSLMRPLQIAYLTQLDSLAIEDETLIDGLVDQLVWFLEYDGVPHRLWLPVGGVNLPDEPLRAGRFEIRRMTDEEVLQFVALRDRDDRRGPAKWQPWNYGMMAWPSALVSLLHDGRNDFTEGGIQAGSDFQRFLTALALLGIHFWAFGARGQDRIEPHWLAQGSRGAGGFAVKDLPFGLIGPNLVTQEVMKEAVRVAERIPERSWKDPNNREEVIYHRFMQGVTRTQAVDEIFDFVVAMESALVNDNKELGFRFAMYGAEFLGSTDAERRVLKKQLNKLYDLRSRLAHGAKFPTGQEISEGAGLARDLCRRVLLKCLDEGIPKPGDLDRELLSKESAEASDLS